MHRGGPRRSCSIALLAVAVVVSSVVGILPHNHGPLIAAFHGVGTGEHAGKDHLEHTRPTSSHGVCLACIVGPLPRINMTEAGPPPAIDEASPVYALHLVSHPASRIRLPYLRGPPPGSC